MRRHRLPAGVLRRAVLCCCGAVLLLAAALGAQDWRRRWLTPPPDRQPDARGAFSFCRLFYTPVRREAGGQGWRTDYPLSDRHLMIRLSELTSTPVGWRDDGEPAYAVVRATDAELFRCPFLFASDVGTIGLTDEEAARLREYLLKGGFLWVDDFWGERAWVHWTGEIRRVLPEHPIVDVTPEHPLFSAVYHVRALPQVPSIQFWRRSGGAVSERGQESAEPRMRAILDDAGRILVLMTHNTDIADGWEREGEEEEFFYAFSPEAYAVGINVVIWAMTH